MITFAIDLTRSGTDHLHDTLRSLSSNASSRDNYEIVIGEMPTEFYMSYIDKAFFVDEMSDASRVMIVIPGDSIALGKDWDKYILWHLDNDRPIGPWEVVKRLHLTGHSESVLSKEITVTYPA